MKIAAHVAGDLVGNGVGEFSKILYAVGSSCMGRDDFNGIAYVYLRVIGDINRHLVHTYAPADGGRFSMNMNNGLIGEGAEITITIADRYDCHAAISGVLMGSSVSAKAAGGHFFDRNDLCIYTHAGSKVDLGSKVFCIVAAIDGKTGADEIEMGVGVMDQGGGIGGVSGEGIVLGEDIEKGV